MKTACFLVLLPLFSAAFAAEKRMVFDSLVNLFNTPNLAKYVNQIVDQVGSDATEQQCETACIDTMSSDLVDTLCPFICGSLQTLVHTLHIGVPPPAKRMIFDDLAHLFSTPNLAKYVNQIVDQVGSDATEQQCETACLDTMASDLVDTLCPFICGSLQTLVQKLHITAPQTAKRMIFDDLAHLFSTPNLAKYVNQIVDQVGSDATEQQCETACLDTMASDLVDTLCPFICGSLQTLVQKLHITAPQTAKRMIFDDLAHLFNTPNLAKYVNQIVDQVGSDATEQQCETACLDTMASDLVDTLCPFICGSLQTLVQKLHITAPQTAKRMIFDDLAHLFSTPNLAKYVNQIVDQVGSDATEQQCETACLDTMASDLVDTLCPFICGSLQTLVQKLHITAPQTAKRMIFDDLAHLFNTPNLAKYVNQIVDQVGSDATEQQCETACLDTMASDLVDTLCPFICGSLQTLVQKLHITAPQTAKRMIFDDLAHLFSTPNLAKYVNQIVDQVGSDATEQQCETACLDTMASDLVDTLCPFICGSLQTLVQKLHINSQPQQPAKRMIFDSVMQLISTPDLAKYVNQIVDKVGSDATEMQCETACIEIMDTDNLDTLCPFMCNSFQSLVHKLHMEGHLTTSVAPAKRLI